MKYRREIDGLRALAVLPVILFHAGFPAFSGGFVGVDVFFAVSGYLITTLIVAEIEQQSFSLVQFYERRARRIMPALLLVMGATTVIAVLWLPPPSLQDYSQSLIAVPLFSSNFLFWLDSGYWGAVNELKPLLHTWSLAVEEQYYLLFPPFLLLVYRFRKQWLFGLLLTLSLGSLLLSQWATSNYPSASFFLLPTRGWEIGIGAITALLIAKHPYFSQTNPKLLNLHDLLGWTGVFLITSAVLMFDQATRFPGFNALIPVLGTALVILFSSAQNTIGKVLGSRLLVGVGLISYSAYLWHQPLFAFARHRSLFEPSPLTFIVLTIVSLLLALITWKVVEAPFRDRSLTSRKQVFTLSFVGSIVFIAIGVGGYLTEGFQDRFEAKFVRSLTAAKQVSFNDSLCKSDQGKAVVKSCVLAEHDGQSVVLFGDSHAESLALKAQQTFSTVSDLGLVLFNQTGCPPIRGLYRADAPDPENCYQHNEQAYETILARPELKYILLIARWTHGMEGSRFNNMEGGVEAGEKPHLDIVKDGKYMYHADYSHRDRLSQAYADSVNTLLKAGKVVVLVYPIPEAGWNVPDYLWRSFSESPDSVADPSSASTSHAVFVERNRRVYRAFDSIPDNSNLVRIYPEKIFCRTDVPGRCITQKDGEIYYHDDDHLTDVGARELMVEVMLRLQEIR